MRVLLAIALLLIAVPVAQASEVAWTQTGSSPSPLALYVNTADPGPIATATWPGRAKGGPRRDRQ
jgi:hypothetical protein